MTAEEAITYLCDARSYTYDGRPVDFKKDCEVRELSVEALQKSLRYAEWIENKSCSARFQCSYCGHRTGYKQARSFNYCPNCGAKMVYSEN